MLDISESRVVLLTELWTPRRPLCIRWRKNITLIRFFYCTVYKVFYFTVVVKRKPFWEKKNTCRSKIRVMRIPFLALKILFMEWKKCGGLVFSSRSVEQLLVNIFRRINKQKWAILNFNKTVLHFHTQQGCESGSGSAWIRINLSCWVRNRIGIQEGKNYPQI